MHKLASMDLDMQARVADTKTVDPLLVGAIDMHYHGYPEITLGVHARTDDVRALELARDSGMRAVVMKSQMWPSMGRVYHLDSRVSGIKCFSSITLNSVVGGLSPWLVEAAGRLGAKVVWLPTWSARHRLGESGFARLMKGFFPTIDFGAGLGCVDTSGKLTADAKGIVQVCKEMDLVLCTGHVSPPESLAVAQEAERIGLTKLIFTHPLSGSVGATLDQVKEMVKRGAYVELCALNVFYGKELDRMLEYMEEIGPEHCILTTDSFMDWVPALPEFLRMFLGRLLISGVDEDSLFKMVRDNPAALLGLPPAVQ